MTFGFPNGKSTDYLGNLYGSTFYILRVSAANPCIWDIVGYIMQVPYANPSNGDIILVG
jgi:hypothetical protein